MFDVSAALRERGWQVPAYTFPKNREDLAALRVVVRRGFTFDVADMLLADLSKQVERLEKLAAPMARRDDEAQLPSLTCRRHPSRGDDGRCDRIRAPVVAVSEQEHRCAMWTILIFIVIGMVAGWSASLLIRREKYPTDWGVLFIIGVSGSLIAGIIVNLIMGDGFKIAPAASSGPSPSPASCCGCTRGRRTARPARRRRTATPSPTARTASARAAASTTRSADGRGRRPAGLRPPAAKPLRRAHDDAANDPETVR